MAVETGWMAAAETRTPDPTKTLAEREASMDGKILALMRRDPKDCSRDVPQE